MPLELLGPDGSQTERITQQHIARHEHDDDQGKQRCGLPDAVKGSAVVCVCVAARNVIPDANLIDQLKLSVAAALGSSFRPKQILFIADLPKTRNGKIMRRLVRSVLLGDAAGDLSGLLNPEALDELRQCATAH